MGGNTKGKMAKLYFTDKNGNKVKIGTLSIEKRDLHLGNQQRGALLDNMKNMRRSVSGVDSTNELIKQVTKDKRTDSEHPLYSVLHNGLENAKKRAEYYEKNGRPIDKKNAQDNLKKRQREYQYEMESWHKSVEHENERFVQMYIEATKVRDHNAIVALDNYYKNSKQLQKQLGPQFKELRKQILHTNPKNIEKLAAAEIEEIYKHGDVIEIGYKNGMASRIDKSGYRDIYPNQARPLNGTGKAPVNLSREQKTLIQKIKSTKGLGMGDYPSSSLGAIERDMLRQLKQLAESTGYGRIDLRRYKSDNEVYALNNVLSSWLGVELANGL